MPDVLTHVLVGYSIGTLVAIHYDRIGPEHVTVVMVGALSPDLTKISILIPDAAVESVLGVPFSWFVLHVAGGNLIVILLGVLVVAADRRKTVFLLLVLGAASHHALDLLLINVSGYAYPVLWPLTAYHPPAGMVYLSSDRWPAVVAGTIAAGLWVLRTRKHRL